MLPRVVMVLHRDADLLEIVLALRAARRFAGRLNRRQQQGDQDADDRDHDQQFDERKARALQSRVRIAMLLSMKGYSCPPGGVGCAADVGWD